jgi:hypothetical protein
MKAVKGLKVFSGIAFGDGVLIGHAATCPYVRDDEAQGFLKGRIGRGKLVWKRLCGLVAVGIIGVMCWWGVKFLVGDGWWVDLASDTAV